MLQKIDETYFLVWISSRSRACCDNMSQFCTKKFVCPANEFKTNIDVKVVCCLLRLFA